MSERDYPYAEIVSFVRKADRRGMYFGGWPNPVLEVFLQWHHENGNLVLKSDEGNLVAVVFIKAVFEADHDQQSQGRGSVSMQDIVEEEEWGMEKDIDGLNRVCHRGLTVFALESVFNKDMEGVK